MSHSNHHLMHLSTVHHRGDIRIALKQAETLAATFRGRVELVVADGLGPSEREGVTIFDLGVLGPNRLTRAILGFARSVGHLRAVRPAVLHFHDPELIPVGIVAKVLGIRVIYDVHEDLPKQILQKDWIPRYLRGTVAALASAAEWLGARTFDAIVPATPKIAERFPPHKTVVVQNFPLNSELSGPPSRPYADRPPSFVYVGGVSRLRGIVQVVGAASRFGDECGVQIDVAGSFSPASLQTEVEQLAGFARTRFHGWMSRDEVQRLFSNARAGLVLFHPVPNHTDAQPNKLFEYMAAGLPVIVSDFPLWRRIVDEARCGLLVNPMDPDAIAGAMRWVLEHPVEAHAMGQRGRAAVVARFNWQSEAKHLIGLYRRWLEKPPDSETRARVQ